jgi:hypothetical protein
MSVFSLSSYHFMKNRESIRYKDDEKASYLKNPLNELF